MLDRKNLVRAYKRVVGNRGSAGVDGMTVEELKGYIRDHWDYIREALLARTYQPHPVLRAEIPKPDGKGKRKLGIPVVIDRLIQQARLQVFNPIFDPGFSDSSYRFRKGRSAHQATLQAREYVKTGKSWVVDIALGKFFDRVNHEMLMARVPRKFKDKRVLKLIRRFLNAGVMENGLVSPAREGTPQGGAAIVPFVKCHAGRLGQGTGETRAVVLPLCR